MSIFGAIVSGLGGMFKSKRESKAQKQALDAQRRSEEMQLAQRRRELEYQRQLDLEDRRYRQEAIAGYRGMGTPGLSSPEFSSTTPSAVGTPQGVDPRDRPTNHQQGLMFYR